MIFSCWSVCLLLTRVSAQLHDDWWYDWQVGKGVEPNPEDPLKQTCFEEYWDSLPSIQTNDSISVNGDSFRSRMAGLRFMIDTDVLVPIFGESSYHVHHWLWAYAAQLDWQKRSNRLDIGSNDTSNDSISTSSWWAYMNYGFSIAILAGAVEARNELNNGKHIELTVTGKSREWLETAEMQQCVNAWKTLFLNVYPEFQKIAETSADISPSNLDRIRFQMQQHVWSVHTSVIESLVSSDLSNQLLEVLPPPDAKFGVGWSKMVEVLAASNFPTNLVTLVKDGCGFLPFQVVTDEYMDTHKAPPKKRELEDSKLFVRESQHRSILATHQLAKQKDMTLAAKFWKRVVGTSPQTAAEMPARVNRLIHGTIRQKVSALLRTLWLFVRRPNH